MNELQRISAEIDKAVAAGDVERLRELREELAGIAAEGLPDVMELWYSIVPQNLAAMVDGLPSPV